MEKIKFEEVQVYDFSNIDLQEKGNENCFCNCDSCDHCDTCDCHCDLHG